MSRGWWLRMNKMLRRFSPAAGLFGGVAAFFLFSIHPEATIGGARYGLALCAKSIIPALFPFMVLASLLSELGLPRLLGRVAAPVMGRLFGVGGEGAAAFVIGLSGGYPLGATNIAGLYQSGAVSKEGAERLLSFCNNSGPAFIVGVAGVGIFGSAKIGFALYGIHILSAVLTGMLLSGQKKSPPHPSRGRGGSPALPGFGSAVTAAVKNCALAMLAICGFVVLFSALTHVLEAAGWFSQLAGRMSAVLGLELHFCAALIRGFLELGSGVGSMAGLSPAPLNLALASWILNWGSVSVHFQTAAVLSQTDLSAKRHLAGKLLQGAVSVPLTLAAAVLII